MVESLAPVYFSDTTLRDGEQMPGVCLGPKEKVQIAQALAEAGVHNIEAGFPACHPAEVEAVKQVAGQVHGPIISAFCRTLRSDIDLAVEALGPAEPKRRGISLFLATSTIHRQAKLHKTPRQLIEMITEAIAYARSHCDRVAFGAEDASRTELDFLVEVFNQAIRAGATTLGFPDTVGIMTPEKVKATLSCLFSQVSHLDKVPLAVHFHNDLGLATANTLAALLSGAQVVQVTVNGLGERAGNAPLEEVVMALLLHQDQYRRQVSIDPTKLTSLSRLVARLTGVPVPRTKGVVGENVFATEAGIHQDGLLKNPETYLPFQPEAVGAEGIRLVLGKHSGRAAFAKRFSQLGYQLTDEEVDQLVGRVKAFPPEAWADEEGLLALVRAELSSRPA